MKYPITNDIPFEEIGNGALILLLLKECKTFEQLCGRYKGANPASLHDTATMNLRDKLFQMRDLGLVSFEDEATDAGKMYWFSVNWKRLGWQLMSGCCGCV